MSFSLRSRFDRLLGRGGGKNGARFEEGGIMSVQKPEPDK